MERRGNFSSTIQGAHAGAPKWMLVKEGEGLEFDAAAARCAPVHVRAVKHCADADRAEWVGVEGWEAADEAQPEAPRPRHGILTPEDVVAEAEAAARWREKQQQQQQQQPAAAAAAAVVAVAAAAEAVEADTSAVYVALTAPAALAPPSVALGEDAERRTALTM